MKPRTLLLLGLACWLGGCAVLQRHAGQKDWLRPQGQAGERQTAAGETAAAVPLDKDQPAKIESDRMQYQNEGQVTIFQGHVVVTQPQARMLTPYLEVRSNEGVAQARGGIELEDYQRGITVTAKEMDYSKNLSDVVIRDNVKVNTRDERGIALKISSQKLEWHAEKDEALATGNVVVHYQDTTATAERIQFQSKGDELVLSSEDPGKKPMLHRGRDSITGRIVRIFTRQRKFEVDGNAQALIMPQEANRPKASEKP